MQVWTHPWVTGSLAAKQLRIALPLLPRSGSTDRVQPNPAILAHLTARGADVTSLVRDLDANECNHLTASYYAFAEVLASGGKLPPPCRESAGEEGGALAKKRAALWHSASNQHSAHSFSLDIEDPMDRDDAAHFAPVAQRT